MRRRTLLALSGSSLAGLAGCLSGSGTDPRTTTSADPATSESPAGTTTESPTTTGTATYDSVSVALDALQPGLVTMTTPDSIGVHPTDGQFLYLDVTTGAEAPASEEFAFEFGGRTYAPDSLDELWRYWRFYDNEGAVYDAESGGGLLLFELPESADSEEAVLSWPGGEWRPDDALRRRLAAPEPPLSVSVEIPETVAVSDHPTIAVTVENDGDVPGRFVAGLNRSGPRVAYTPVERVSAPVPAGETNVLELTDDDVSSGDYSDSDIGDDEPDVTYHFNWDDDSVSREVRYARTPASTTDTA